MAEKARRDRSPSLGAELNLNLRWHSIGLLIAAGWIGCQAIALFVPRKGPWLSLTFVAFAAYGLVFVGLTLTEGVKLLQKSRDDDVTFVGKVYAKANMRREVFRATGHLTLALLGIFSLLDVPWFGQFFVSAMFYLAYVMDVNSTFDSTLDRRLRKAEAEEVRVQAERAYQERMAKEFIVAPDRKKKSSKRKPKKG